MSSRRQLERRMMAEGKTSLGAFVPTAELRREQMALAEKLLGVLFARQPAAPLVLLMALEVARRHVVLSVDEAPLSDEDRARFWAGLQDEMEAYEEAIKARRS